MKFTAPILSALSLIGSAAALNLNHTVTAPDAATCTNGIPSRISIKITNNEPNTVTLQSLSAALVKEDGTVLRNFTDMKIGKAVKKGQNIEKHFVFTTHFDPQFATLELYAAVQDSDKVQTVIPAYKGQVQIVEPEAGIFDPQMWFLYLLLLTGFSTAGWYAYNTWFVTVTPKRRRD
ncbi:hypothetical protein FPQ18DRAFT_342867 [Pyronema domesticum]|uniref:Similar to Increased recombination centers protein 22-2 acc. no. C5M501 n=1 Tax=Pyronema omphalodes (strain CBS 100304) TaxID=1076935 RepID=U4LS84_PYROM|nr:hypothetical protein FPQ18DRAFT_342867 [Pyronema domesticum]CCX34449.1 Similar to Increased recombination centers protein 22-2; acc. no. C5M501 [Pyronema omphalodes CBS 100304]